MEPAEMKVFRFSRKRRRNCGKRGNEEQIIVVVISAILIKRVY